MYIYTYIYTDPESPLRMYNSYSGLYLLTQLSILIKVGGQVVEYYKQALRCLDSSVAKEQVRSAGQDAEISCRYLSLLVCQGGQGPGHSWHQTKQDLEKPHRVQGEPRSVRTSSNVTSF